jgi:hypothetical protein
MPDYSVMLRALTAAPAAIGRFAVDAAIAPFAVAWPHGRARKAMDARHRERHRKYVQAKLARSLARGKVSA